MSLRAKLLLLFGLLGVLPLLFVGLFDYVNAMRTVEAHLAAQEELIAEPMVRALEERFAVLGSDLSLLAENSETQRLLRAARLGGTLEVPPVVAAYLDQAWSQFAPWYSSIEVHDARGRVVYHLGTGPAEVARVTPRGLASDPLRVERRVSDLETGEELGSVVAFPRPDALLPAEVLGSRYGAQGYTLVVDREAERILHHPRFDLRGETTDSLPAELTAAIRDTTALTVAYRQGDTSRVAVLAHFGVPPLALVTTSSVDEFAAPFVRMRLLNLGVVLMVIVTVSLISALLIRRETRSLAQLTAAADQVGQGDFAPALPSPGGDEVGRLSAAFGAMTTRVREMMAEIESSRQLAAIGEFAAEIAHEIRNPLTSVKLNLQRLQRLGNDDRLPAEATAPLAISMREIQRLERVVRGVLYLGRAQLIEPRSCSLHEIAAEAVDLIRPQAERNSIAVATKLHAAEDRVAGDAEQLKGAILNLLLNAVEAMPSGGTLEIATLDAPDDGTINLRVSDTGTGIPKEARERLFRPFYTTKPGGTGLGLAIAKRTIEEHGGRLALEASGEAGSAFRVELPLTRVAMGAEV